MKTPKQPTIEEKKAREQRIHERRMKHKRPKKRFQFWKNIEFWVIFGLFAFIAYTRYVYHNNTELLNDDYKITVYGNSKVYHLVIEKCTTFQSGAKLHLI